MNKFFSLCLLFSLGSGCSQKKPSEPTAAQISENVGQIEKSVAQAARENSEILEKVQTIAHDTLASHSNISAKVITALNELTTDLTDRMDRIERRVAALETNNSRPGPLAVRPQIYAMTNRPTLGPGMVMRDGVPIAIWNQIFSEAQKLWPRDFHMQEYELKSQIEAYRKLHR